jgi:peptidoglycan hydrolase-like amidase
LGSRADFSSTAGFVRLLFDDGTWTRYHGTVGALRQSSTSELTINRVSLDQYTEGVVPREMPASWHPAAVAAQAVAARSYAASEMAANKDNSYDICDTSSCQVYGGYQHVEGNGTLIWQDDPASIVGNSNEVLTYKGSPIFAQYSASNGGATADGGEPYLVGKVDPYDDAASGDPYLDVAGSVPVSTLANAYGLKSVSSIQITQRDGIGPWGGRVLEAKVIGTSYSGKTTSVPTDGFTLAYSIGAATNWFRFDTEAPLPQAPTALHAAPANAAATISWAAPSNALAAQVSGYRVSFGGHTVTTSAAARSFYAAPITLNSKEAITVTAVGATGLGMPASVSVQALAAPLGIVPMTPTPLFDTHDPTVTVNSTRPFTFNLSGHVPASATAVQLVVGVVGESTSGTLRVSTSGVQPTAVAAIAYSPGTYSAATVSVPLQPSTTLTFTPSAGSLGIVTSLMSYSSPTGAPISMITPTVVRASAIVPTGAGTSVSLSGVSGLSGTTTGVVVQVGGTAHASPGWLRVWGDSSTIAHVEQVAVSPASANVNTIIVPITATHRIRIAASTADLSGRVSVIGLVGTATGGHLETFPVEPTADSSNAAHPAVTVGKTPVTVRMAGVGQLPSTGIRAPLVLVTVHASAAGSLSVYPAGTPVPASSARVPNVTFAGSGSQTSTMLVPVGTGGALELVSSGPTVSVDLDSLGDITLS